VSVEARPVRARTGVVASYDDRAGYGEILDDDGRRWWFHCTAVADGSRTIIEQSTVCFQLAAGHLGRYEAVDLHPA
jgi:cold shock CspA family protein